MGQNTIIGTELCELSGAEKERLGINFGVKIVGPISGLLSGSNLSEGFIITKIDGKAISSLEQLELQLADEQGVMIEGIYPDGTHDRYFTKGFQV
jgi:hypothetical protein